MGKVEEVQDPGMGGVGNDDPVAIKYKEGTGRRAGVETEAGPEVVEGMGGVVGRQGGGANASDVHLYKGLVVCVGGDPGECVGADEAGKGEFLGPLAVVKGGGASDRGTGQSVSNDVGLAGPPDDVDVTPHGAEMEALEALVGHVSQGLVEDAHEGLVIHHESKGLGGALHPEVAPAQGPHGGQALELDRGVAALGGVEGVGPTGDKAGATHGVRLEEGEAQAGATGICQNGEGKHWV